MHYGYALMHSFTRDMDSILKIVSQNILVNTRKKEIIITILVILNPSLSVFCLK